MPGKTIGKQFNPTPELVWQGRISIQKTGGKHDVQYQFEEGTPEICKLVHDHIGKVVQELQQTEQQK